MWTAIFAAINWLSSGAFTAIANGVVNVLNKKTDARIAQLQADKETDIAAIQSAVPILQAQAAITQQRWGWWGTRYMALAAALGPIIHANAIYLDFDLQVRMGDRQSAGALRRARGGDHPRLRRHPYGTAHLCEALAE